MSRYGNHFEREAILTWLQKNNFCPVTSNPLRPSNLVSDKTLQWKINYWAQKNGFELGTSSEDKSNESIGFVAIPQERFICPLTHSVMEDPVMTREGINFERSAILKWLEQKGEKCPVTKKKLTMSGLVPNGKLRWEIQQWQLHEGDASKEMSKLELEGKLAKAEMVSRNFGLSDIVRALTLNEQTPEMKEETKIMEKEDVLAVLDDVMDAL